jgi:hypothetical protein
MVVSRLKAVRCLMPLWLTLHGINSRIRWYLRYPNAAPSLKMKLICRSLNTCTRCNLKKT